MTITLKDIDTKDLSPESMFLTALIERYIAMLNIEEIPIDAQISVAAVLEDLFVLAELPPPKAVRCGLRTA